MGRINGNNIMRTPQEKEAIVLEYMSGGISTRAIAEKYGTDQSVINKWLKKYRESNIEGLKSKTGKTGIGKGNFKKTEIEQLKEDLLKNLPGFSIFLHPKEYVSILDANIK